MTSVKSKFVQYYVEGDDEKTLVDVLKTKLGVIKPGKVQKLNVVQQEITDARLRTLSRGTMVVLIFDTDTDQLDILNKNLRRLKACSSVSEIVTIPQVPNLEGELIRSCNIRNIKELLNSKSREEFKSDLIRTSNLEKKLQEHQFNISLFWSKEPPAPYQNIANLSAKVKRI